MDIASLVHLVIYLIGIGCILGLLLYLVSISPVPEPWKTWLRFAVIFFAVVILIFLILNVIGSAPRLRM